MNILIVDDDPHILHLLQLHLSQESYIVHAAKNGMEALDVLKNQACDIAVVDVMMPYMDGYDLTKEIRDRYDIPVLLLTAKGGIEDKERGYNSGTDDYLVKPFEPKELLFRLKALARRYGKKEDENVVRIGTVTADRNKYEVSAGDRTLLLPLKEFELLYLFMSNPDHVMSRDMLIERVWGIDYEGDERTVDVHVKRLRERLSGISGDFVIKTVRGVGYALEMKR
ncbi:two-component system response regulator [[Bacillus] enclensis]|jgi:two-component system, OmpR family, response regulator|uniref:Heme response regulator HssR n=2 Tax=Rossellomorea TaxID=2837508 RepID=A0A0V8HPB3_9BACI|nr:two-component system response regulator [[Bacillus] enclensis]SCB73930.1 DNA-binding response regulator, OmpR family, contains REC and winged-helix (wHTH) domain [[Bacillus] enclensis]